MAKRYLIGLDIGSRFVKALELCESGGSSYELSGFRQVEVSGPEHVRDAIHAAVMANNDVTAIATFDTGFDRMPGMSRVPLG